MSKKTFADRLKADRRLVLLRLLNEQPGKQANSSTLHAGLQFVHIVAERHEVIDDLRFLQMHQLVELEQLGDVNPDLYGVKLRSRGMDIVAGLVEVEGISPARRP
ncbi:MAG: ArsR family transcriptional regulator [Stenotrophomonas sp.]|uniref:ArsR family transcriptional regulator n=1 Tax=Stenotrophomonas sp. TaxID=69392 RepID=UPI001355479B|nr:ArsR family transcriptional regulator [Stenotrophomonas sp.]MTI74713.1 ArsR family transcriptional regulator [Stenotrophomonas sp.]